MACSTHFLFPSSWKQVDCRKQTFSATSPSSCRGSTCLVPCCMRLGEEGCLALESVLRKFIASTAKAQSPTSTLWNIKVAFWSPIFPISFIRSFKTLKEGPKQLPSFYLSSHLAFFTHHTHPSLTKLLTI